MNWSTYLFNIKHKEELNDTHCWHNRAEEGSNPKYNKLQSWANLFNCEAWLIKKKSVKQVHNDY